MSDDEPKINTADNGELTSDRLEEQFRRQERALAEEQEERQALEYRLKEVNRKLRKHNLSVDELVNGDADPSKLQKLQVASCKRTRLEWEDFPLGVLPTPVREYARAQSEAMSIDPAMVVTPSLAGLSAAVGNSRHVNIKSNWSEPATLWTMLIQASGTLKSPAMEKALAPHFRIERKLRDEWEKEVNQWEEKDKDERGPKPTRERRLANDATVESLALLHDDNPRGLLLYRDELAGWLGSFNQYNKGDSDLQNWIEFYESRPVQVDRKSSDRPSIFVDHPSVAITGTIQPEVLEDRLTSLHFQSGFVARTLMCKPPEKPRRFNDNDVTRETRQNYRSLVKHLYSLVMPDRNQYHVEKDLDLSSEATEVYGEFFDECQKKIEKLSSGPLRSMVAKNQAVGARLALIFQLCEEPYSDVVGRDAMIAGTKVAHWFRNEAARIYQRHGFNEWGVSEDRRRARKLPTGTFGVDKIQEVWDCAQRTAYNVRDRLVEQGLLEKEGHGEYRSLIAEGEIDPFEHFAL